MIFRKKVAIWRFFYDVELKRQKYISKKEIVNYFAVMFYEFFSFCSVP